MVTYENASYYGKSLPIPGKNSTISDNNVTIYEATKSDSDISITVHHYIINPAEGFLNVEEMVQLKNKGDRTYVGSIPAQNGKFVTVNYYLPKDASQVSLGQGLMSCCIFGSGTGFFDTMTILPGTKTITFTYRINSDKKEFSFDKKLSLPTKEFDVLLENNSVKLTSNKLTAIPVPDKNLKGYSARNLNAGENIDINLAGLAGTPADWSSITLGIFLGLLLTVGFFIYIRQKKINPVLLDSGTGIIEDIDEDEENAREKLLDEIVELDERYKQGEIKEEFYVENRNELKNRLEEIP